MNGRIAGVALVAALLGAAPGTAQPSKGAKGTPRPGASASASAAPAAAASAAPTGSASAAPAASAAPTGSASAAPAASAAPSASVSAPATAAEEAARTFQLGREAFKADDCARALEHFQRSYLLEATPGTLLNIALTEEKLGKTATALQSFERVIGLLKADDDRLPIAKEGAARVTLRAPRLKIERAAGAPPTLAIKIDGAPLAANLVGVEQPLDPGKHTVTTSVFGFEERTYEVTLVEGQRVPLAVEPGKRTLILAPVSTGARRMQAHHAARAASIALVGAGLAGLGVGIAAGVLALSKKDELAVACPSPPACDAAGARALGEARTFADISTGTLIFGGVAAAAGVALLFTIGDGKSLFVSASATPGAGGISATGRF